MKLKHDDQAVLSIWIGRKKETQGKICLIDGKACFVANMTERKWFRKFGGYAIAKRITDAFSKTKVSPKIVYKREDLNTYYTTTRTRFQNNGLLVAYGGHSQYILPIMNWKAIEGKLKDEPRGLPVVDVSSWVKRVNPSVSKTKKPKPKPQEPVLEDFSAPMDVKVRLAESFFERYPDLKDRREIAR